MYMTKCNRTNSYYQYRVYTTHYPIPLIQFMTKIVSLNSQTTKIIMIVSMYKVIIKYKIVTYYKNIEIMFFIIFYATYITKNTFSYLIFLSFHLLLDSLEGRMKYCSK